MIDTSFIDLTKEENLRRMNIDPRLIEPFKRVMYRLQEVFNELGITALINYKEMFEKYALNNETYDEEKLKISKEFKEFCIKREERNKRLQVKEEISSEELFKIFLGEKGILTLEVHPTTKGDVRFSYIEFHNKIVIDESMLDNEEIDQLLSHEFIHFITCSGDKRVTTIYKDFYVEVMTELINKLAYKNANGYSILGKLVEYSRYILGITDFTRFLKREEEPKYTEEWKVIFIKANHFFLNHFYRGIDTIKDVKKEDLDEILELQRMIISIIINKTSFLNPESILYSKNLILRCPYYNYDKEYIDKLLISLDYNYINSQNFEEVTNKKL